jgi:hypothetical protein
MEPWARPRVIEAPSGAIEPLRLSFVVMKAMLFDFCMPKELNCKSLILCCSCSHCKDTISKI